MDVRPLHIICFSTKPGQGCEPANFGLCRYPGEVSDPGFGRHQTKLKCWSWHSFCKTHYASDPRCGGLPNFLRCHLGVVALLDEAQRLGILGKVSDEGDFWETRSLERLTALFLWTLQSTKPVANDDKKAEITDTNEEEEPGDDEDEQKAKKAKAGFSMPFDTFIRLTRPMGIHYAALEGRVIDIEKGVVRLLPVRERSEQLLGEAATRPGAVISLEDVQQMELGLAARRQDEATLPSKPKRGQKVKAVPGQAQEEAMFTVLNRIHRAMLLFSLGRSTLLRQVLEKELRQSKRFERLALSLNALYPDGSDERRMLEGVQAAMRGI